ncbi:MAG: glycosyltransferase family 4 protein [Bacteroidales bacterium]|nr:glycosyltransferase family 4 protein [Bacteroidales bacterium]
MNIAVNTRLLIDDIHGGIEWFTYETLSRITRDHPGHNFYFLFDREVNDSFIFSSNITPVVIKPKTVHPVLWYYWFEKKIPPILNNIKADLFLSPDGILSLSTKIPSLPVIHDISFCHRRKDLPFLKSWYNKHFFRKFAEKAVRIATVSEYSKKDMVNTWGTDPAKIDVIYNGASESFYPLPGHSDLTEQEDPYFLFVGNISPRKNIPNLIKAYNLFRDNSSSFIRLIIAGDRFFLNGDLELDRVISRSPYRNDIIFTGQRTRDQLRDLYNGAEALIFVPWFEGFGVPVVEAMRCGTPVIASNTTSIPEIAGEAAILVNPGNPQEIQSAMSKVAWNTILQKDMISKGFNQAAKFTWDNSAEQLWESILKTTNTR